jgi:hypothetical protein
VRTKPRRIAHGGGKHTDEHRFRALLYNSERGRVLSELRDPRKLIKERLTSIGMARGVGHGGVWSTVAVGFR